MSIETRQPPATEPLASPVQTAPASAARLRIRPELCTAGLGGLAYLIVLGLILLRNDGVLTYTLDDPYIHLAMAENLLSGHYGINLEEPSAPASSILFPVLLAVLLALQAGSWAPAILNFAATLGSFWLIQGLLGRSGLGPKQLGSGSSVFVGVVVGLAFNLIGVAFTGMEHSVHVCVTLLALHGLVEVTESERAPGWLWPALIAGPLIRFEGLAVSAPALVALFLLGYRRASAITGGLIVATMAGYVFFLVRLGLPPLPTSVLMKSSVASSAVDVHSPFALARAFLGNALEAIRGRAGLLLFLFAAVTAVGALAPEIRRSGRRLLVPAVAVTAAIGHLFAGRFGWFERYEIYIVLFEFLSMLYVWRGELAGYAQRARLGVVCAAAALLIVNVPYVQATALTPSAARNIYEQQYQMHRFATEIYQAPVAVNDLGWVSFQNPHYVLDLWGLGSEEARRARTLAQNPQWMEQLTSKYGVGVAMVYKAWFPQGLPDSWTRVARLRMDSARITAAGRSVAIYRTPEADSERVMDALQQFSEILPKGTRLDIFDAPNLRTVPNGEPAGLY